MHRSTTFVVVIASAVACPGRATAQAPTDTASVLARAAAMVATLGERSGESIWPAYRPDTIPLVFVLPRHGSFLFHWRGELPPGFSAVPGVPGAAWRDALAVGAANTGTTIAGRPTAQAAVSSLDLAYLVPTAFHEAFHVFERAIARDGRRLGHGENSMLVSTYPVFDAPNEAVYALEGRALAAALRAQSAADMRTMAAEFSAIREGRHRRMNVEMVEFDQMAELNEGLAEYALVRALRLLSADVDPRVRASARTGLAALPRHLDSLTANVSQSIRFRFYATGPAMALLLDRLEPRWKARLASEDLTLEELLAQASGQHAAEVARLEAGERRFGAARLATQAVENIARLKALRLRQVDSILAHPGVELVVDAKAMSGGDFGRCGYDPQNLLRVSATIELHTRWLRPCNTNTTFGEYNTPVVHDEEAGTLTAIVGTDADVALTVGGAPVTLRDGEHIDAAANVKLVTPVMTYQAGKADLERSGRVLRVRLLP